MEDAEDGGRGGVVATFELRFGGLVKRRPIGISGIWQPDSAVLCYPTQAGAGAGAGGDEILAFLVTGH
jgi:hypothetical protein